jgi:hypothetical protein
VRFASLVLLLSPLLATPLAPSGDGGATATGPTATLDCPRAAGPGRVRCEVEARPPAGAVIKWADVEVLTTPPFASPLRARVGPSEASIREEAGWHWTLALAARGRGTGEIAVRVRLVSCVRDVCTPSEVPASAALAVGD